MARIDEVGNKYGRLVVKESAFIKHGMVYWLCVCQCGNEKVVCGKLLRSGNTKSCTCLQKEVASTVGKITGKNLKKINTTHGGTGTKLYSVWKDMKYRCNNPNSQAYKWYGGRGIRVCIIWHKYPAFKEWALANRYADNLTIHRINNDKGYFPDNCEWITQSENSKKKET